MKILIDTNVLLWVLFDGERLTKKEKLLLQDKKNEVIVSAISIFEISLKFSIGKLELHGVSPEDIPPLLLKNGYLLEEIGHDSLSSFYKSPLLEHKDPFDRLIIWEAIKKNYTLMTRDKEFASYQINGLKLL